MDNDSELKLFQNSGYIDHRNQKQILILDIDQDRDGSAGGVFKVSLAEPLIIDKLSDIYLDSLTTWNCNPNTTEEARGFILDIDQLEIKTNSNTVNFYNKIFIPNSASNASQTTLHKTKKLNYICSINPTTLSTISGSLKHADGVAAWNNSTGTTPKATLEFVIISRNTGK